MKKILIFATILFISFLTILYSCQKEDKNENEYEEHEKENENENETKISFFGSNESHNMGQNCMNCHIQGGTGEGWFNIAGTIYDSAKKNVYPNSTVKLYTGPNGSGNLKYTIQVDGKGNFYSTNNIEFGGGLYPSVSGNNSTKFMSSTISIGSCNSCHGNTTDKIWTK